MKTAEQERGADRLELALNECRRLRSEAELLRAKLKAAERELKRSVTAAADAERRATFAEELLEEERRLAQHAADEPKQESSGDVSPEPEEPPSPERREPVLAEVPAPEPAREYDHADPPSEVPGPIPVSSKPERRSLVRLVRRRQSAPAAPGKCSVCDRSAEGQGEADLAAAGWLVSGGVGVCDRCESKGWELQMEALLPFRRAGRDGSQAS